MIPRKINQGELVHVLGTYSITYCFRLKGIPNPHIYLINFTQDIKTDKKWPDTPKENVHTLLERWLKGTSITLDDLIENLNLPKHLRFPLANADDALKYKINTIKAILDRADIIEFISCNRIKNFTEFIYGLQNFLLENFLPNDYNPVLVVYDAEDLIALSYIADRVMEPTENQLREVMVDF